MSLISYRKKCMNQTKIRIGIDFLMLFSSDVLAMAGGGVSEAHEIFE